jgi:hypothetical protein
MISLFAPINFDTKAKKKRSLQQKKQTMNVFSIFFRIFANKTC